MGSFLSFIKGDQEKKSTFFQRENRYGTFQFQLLNDNGVAYEDPLKLVWKDFNDHVLITGGSGSGKTSTVLNQLYEGLVFRASLHSDSEKEKKGRVGGLVIEAKGDFTQKTEVLAQRYQREDSVVYFGPNHPEFVYDPFSDPDELPLQKAHKVGEILKAASGGREASDPFWEQAAQKLLSNLMILHDVVQKSGSEVPPLSFHYLNLLCMDKTNSSESNSGGALYSQRVRDGFSKIRSLLGALQWDFDRWWREVDSDGVLAKQVHEIKELIVQLESSLHFESALGKKALIQLEEIREEWKRGMEIHSMPELKEYRGQVRTLYETSEQIQLDWKNWAKQIEQRPTEGPLEKLLKDYERILKAQGQELSSDLIWSYFRNEFLNPANEKTSASVAMVVSNALMPFVNPPLNRLFSPQATFDFRRVIDKGLLVVLDMPSAQYGVAQLLAALVLKIDFFRTVLNRPRLRTFSSGERVNQERHLIYLCDEFGSVATSGDQTGEASFLDKVREYRCSCLLAMQGLPSLLRKFPEKEVDALLQNCGIKIFLRNDDPSTNDYASRSLGSEIKIRLNQNAGAMEHFMDTQKKWGSRAYSTHYERGARWLPDEFVTFRIGEGILRLPARFGDEMIRKVHFNFCSISNSQKGEKQ